VSATMQALFGQQLRFAPQLFSRKDLSAATKIRQICQISEEYFKAYPELTVDLITREGLGDLISDGYDLAIRFGEPRPSTLVARRLLDTRVLAVASPGY
jgi:DNA-binding transcriptional LysR family regulator